VQHQDYRTLTRLDVRHADFAELGVGWRIGEIRYGAESVLGRTQ
jgi:hypothetical protein